jgi:hypothetical protein
MAREENDWQDRAELGQAILQLRTAQVRNPDVEKNATQFALVRQPLQQMLGCWIGRNCIAGILKTPLYRSPKRRIIVNDMNGARQNLPLMFS